MTESAVGTNIHWGSLLSNPLCIRDLQANQNLHRNRHVRICDKLVHFYLTGSQCAFIRINLQFCVLQNCIYSDYLAFRFAHVPGTR